MSEILDDQADATVPTSTTTLPVDLALLPRQIAGPHGSPLSALGTTTDGPSLPAAAVVTSAPPSLTLLGLPREIRNMIYDTLLEGTKTMFNFRNSKMYALYKVDGNKLPGSPLPQWFLTSKMVLKEGIEQLQIGAHVEMPLSYLCSNETSTTSILIDPTGFQTLVLTSPSHDETFGVEIGHYRQKNKINTHGQLLRLYIQYVDRITVLIDHLKIAPPSRINRVRIELNNVARSKKLGLDLNILLELGARLPGLKKMELCVEQGVEENDDHDSPDKWFYTFKSLVGTLLGFGNFEVNTSSTVLLDQESATDYFGAEKKDEE